MKQSQRKFLAFNAVVKEFVREISDECVECSQCMNKIAITGSDDLLKFWLEKKSLES